MKTFNLQLITGFFLSLIFFTNSTAQITNQIRQGNRYDAVDRSKGLNDTLHHDGTGRIRTDLFKRSITQFQLMQDGQTAYLGANVDWQQIGPSPATVNASLEGNGQMPGPNGSAIIDLVIDPSGSTDMTAYAIPNDGGVWKTTDGGNLWTPKTDKLGTLSFGALALDPSNPQIIYAGTGNIFNNGYFKAIGIYVSNNGGDSWALTSGSSVLEGIGINKMVVPRSGTILVGTSQGLYCSTNSGTTYAKITIDGQNNGYITDLEIQDGGTKIWAAVYGKGIYVSTDSGNSFGPNLLGPGHGTVPSMDTIGFISLGASSDGNTLYANGAVVGQKSDVTNVAVWKSTNAGGTWTEITDKAIVKQSGIPNWKQVKNCQCGYDQTFGVDPTNANRVYMGFQDLWLSEDGGDTWKDISYSYPSMKEAMHVDHHALAFSPPSHRTSGQPTRIWVGNDGGIWSSSDKGSSWTNHNKDTSASPKMSFATNLFRGIDTGRGSGNNDYTYGGMQDTGTAAGKKNNAAGTDDPQPWNEWAGGDGGKTATSWQDPKKAYGQWGGDIFYTRDGGVTNGYSSVACNGGQGPGGFNELETNPTNNEVYIAGNCGGQPTIFYSTNNGSNYGVYYQFMHINGNARSIAVTPADGTIMYVSLSDGSIEKLTKVGTDVTATNLTTPAGINGQVPTLAVNQKDANMLIAVYAGYSRATLPAASKHVFLSTDGGMTWRDISGFIKNANVPDMPIYSAVFDPNTTPNSILVASDMGVFRTYDFGMTWHVAGSNLPNVHTVDLEIDGGVTPSLVKAGTYGRSTWASELPVGDQVFGQVSPNFFPATNINWINNSNEDLTISWVSNTGDQHPYGTIPAKGSHNTTSMYYTGVTVVKDQSGNVVLMYVVNNIANQTVTISQTSLDQSKSKALKGYPGLCSFPYNGSVPVSNFPIQNNSSQDLNVYWINTSGQQVLMARLNAGRSTTVGPVFFGGTFTFNSLSGKVLGVFVASDAPNQTMMIDDTLINSWD